MYQNRQAGFAAWRGIFRGGRLGLRVVLLLAVLVMAALVVLPAERADAQTAQTLVSNLGQADGGTGGFSNDHAQAFTTGSEIGGYLLTAVDFSFPTVGDGDLASKLTVSIHRDDDGTPGNSVGTLTKPSPVTVGTNSFTHSSLQLYPRTTYWVVVDVDGSGALGTNTIQHTASDAEDLGGADGWSIADDSHFRTWNVPGASWTSFAESKEMAIRGTVVARDPLTPNLDGSYTVPFGWPLKPSGLGQGDEFRLVFITSAWRDATAADIDVYDIFVQNIAREGHAAIRPYAHLFRVVGSTAAVDARDHTATNPRNSGHPDASIWWLNGQRIAQNKAGFWSSTWENWAMADRRFETGAVDTGSDWPWTGTQTDGTKHSADHLGNTPNVARGRFWSTSGDTEPIDHNRAASVQDHAFYAISPRFKVGSTTNAPPGEPAVLSNLGEADGTALGLTTSDRAQSFTTGNNGGHYVLNSVDIEFAQVGDSDIGSKLRVQVLNDSGGAPDRNSVVGTLMNPAFQTGTSDRTFTFTYMDDDVTDGTNESGLRLEPNTTYWVVVMDRFINLTGTNTLRVTASNTERQQGLRLPDGWRIGNDRRDWSTTGSSWSSPQAEALKIGLNLGAADPFVQFRTCEGDVSGNSCSTDWVIANYTRHDPPPTITLTEGSTVVTYQWQAVDPRGRRHHRVSDQVTEPRSNFGGYMGPGSPDRDRLICHTGGRGPHNLGDPIVYVPPPQAVRMGYGSTAGPLLDRHDGCPFVTQFIYENDTNKWRPVSVAAGQDSDAFDHQTFLIHSPQSIGHSHILPLNSFDFPEVHVPLIIRDDDEWEQDLEFSIDDGATWMSLQDGGLSLAFPPSLNTGRKAHYFWVRLKNDPPADQSKRFSVIARHPSLALLNTGTSEYFRSHRIWFTSPAASHLHTFREYDIAGGSGSVTVSRTPIQVDIHVGDNFTGTVTFDVEGFKLYERNDNQISTETPPKTVRTKSFSFYRKVGSCVGCQRLLGDLPDPVVERVGGLSFANLSDSGIDLSWPQVVGAEGYEVRYWSTTSPFPGVPADEAWFGAEPTDPAWNIRHLEPDTEYRAVVYYQDHGATQLSTASPVIRFTTLSAGSPVQAEPTSVIVERMPEVSISAASGTITEGEDATFTVTVEPAPDAPLDVRVHVVGPSAGSVVAGQHLGTRTVNVPTSGSASFTIPTNDDARSASNGMLGAGVSFGEGYRPSKFKSYASVYIANNDLPPPPLVQLKEVTDTTATIAWKPQEDGATYMVVWHEAFAGIPVLTEVTTTETEYQLTGLDPESYYTVSVLVGSTQLGQLTVTTLAAGATAQTFTVDFETPAPNTSLPVISVTADGDVTEGGDASFTVTANPAPDADLDVSVTVSQSGDYGATMGQQTVTIPSAGYAALTVATTNDDLDEADGSVTATVDAGSGYTVSSTQGAATVSVSDNDGGHTVNPGTIAQVRELASQTQHGAAHVNRWNRVLLAFGEHDGTGVTGGPMAAADAQEMADRHSSPVWDLVVAELTALEAAAAQTPPPPTPEVSVSGGSGVTEGGSATFTVTANPAPAANLDVKVTVTQSGDYGATTGQRTVTVPTTGSVSFTVGTTDDSADEADGSVTATVDAGSGYTVSSTQGAATVSVSDNDDAPMPEVSVSGGSGVTEGGSATFTVTANPAPAANLDVKVTVTQSGDYGATTGQRTVTVPTTGSVSFTVGTTDDSADEADGSVTATVDAGSGYTVSSTQGAATVSVSDNDDAPMPEVSVSGGSGVTEGGSATFTVTANPAPAANLDVKVTVTQSGDYGATTGQRTVTVPTTGSVSFTVGTTDDSADEADGSVTATVDAGSGYTVSSTQGAATVSVSDNDGGHTVNPGTIAQVRELASQTQHGAAHVNRWNRVLLAFGEHDGTGVTGGPMAAADAQEMADRHSSPVWDLVVAELTALEAAAAQTPPPPTPEVSVSGGSGVTEGGSATFTVTANPAPAANLDVKVTVTQSGDYGATTGQRTVTVPTTGSVSFTVGTTDDSADEADGSVTATVDAGSGYTVSSTQGAATVSVSDNDDAPMPEVSVSGGSGVTEGGSATFTVTANPAPAANLDVKVTVTQSGDYGATTGQRTVTVPTTGSVSFTVGTTDDSADEADGSVTATVDAGSGYTVSSTQGAATVSVSDNDDAPMPEVSVSGGSGVTEGGSATFTVTANPAPAANLDVKVTVTQSGDYGATTGQRTVTVPTTGSVSFTVGTTDDSADEADGSVTATVDAGSGYTVSSTQGAATVSVSDNDDAPMPEVSVSGGSGVTEGGSATFTVTANPAPAANLDVKVTVTQSGDYGATTGQRTVTVPTTGSVSFTVGTTDDSADEADGSVTATVDAGSGYTVSSTQGAATVSVSDNDDAPMPEVSVSGGSGVTEGGSATFTVTANPAPAANLDVKVTVTQSGDYGATTGQRTVTVPTTGSVSFTVGTTDDSADEADGSVTATVDAGSGYTVSSTQGAATVSVSDNDDAPMPEVSVSGGSGVTEGGSATFTVTANPAPAANLDVKVTVTQSGDYGATTGQRTVTVPTTGSVSFTVGTTDDSADEADGSVTATVDAGSGYTVSSTQGAATVSVSDNDDAPMPEVSVSGGSGVTEGGSATFTVTANPAPAANLDVKVTVTQSGDYGATTGQRTVTVPTTGSVSFTVGTTDDSADEADGSVTATVDAGSGYTVSSTQGAATVSVSDNDDAPMPEVSVSGGSGVTEGGSATFTVTANPAPAANLDVKVTVTQSGDYGATTGQRTVTVPTTGSVSFTVGTTDDSADEADGSVTATVDAGSGYTVSSTQGAATVSVSDNDDAPMPEVSVSGGSGVTEGGSATFTVTANPAPAANLDVKVTVTQSGDYGATTGQRTVTVPTTGSVSFTVGTTDDSADEADGSVTATVDAGSGYTVSSTQGAATVSVSDNDDAPEVEISVTVADGSAVEGDVLEFRVRLSAASTEEIRVRWFTATTDLLDDRAHTSDYQAAEGELVFAPGVTELTGEVWLEQDDDDEPDEYFAVEAYLPGSLRLPDAVGTMTIVDDD